MSVVSVKDSDASTRHFKLNKDLKLSTGWFRRDCTLTEVYYTV